jgi:hypothetical protein
VSEDIVAIPKTALVMPGPSWALSAVKDAVPLHERRAFYEMLSKAMASKQYAEICDLPDPWRERTMVKYKEWQEDRGL